MASQTITVGPWGGPGGNEWDDGSYTGIRIIELSYKEAIGSFSVIYDLNGEPFSGSKHTSKLPYTNVKIELQFPEEFLVSVSGYTAPFSSLATRTPVVRSLKFKTNKGRTFGPYGEEDGTYFNLPIENGLVVGFKGRTGDLLDAIGVHMAL
uniref:Frutapin n=1 Tax=Artocarpus altilis TaxID=194251 RepID=A0A2D0TC52_ARTAL|nr:Chain A, Frutapin [Artocarpus altilis]5KRP_B Chain B, Frutapin [Artocarpus altilis]5KRP_C Chain C, Frutapin [Artocarpus altilis]5KRP_D Chain D, Frutapin [Artocarpus altilis]5M6O_A Chain A, Frutapin [Artocarpus altilis]5M6O_B Chain B, Frutapin [Artocarpus altilis]5M6O_C Chain C, Frutapin [Artocarpus altilis]5M6O_D Chain D, Frutapin [Artocarpus altilis]5TQZ_A Chain A, Frutapin [Artocarpus altilis]5TQZ_B Chain B, Frutapin [Artocarpus altilis]5TQZ_C Chain C, Frutapin [Artocarpus altilis]5